MPTTTGPVYVVGAAGHQGGSAFRHLRALGVETHGAIVMVRSYYCFLRPLGPQTQQPSAAIFCDRKDWWNTAPLL